MRSLALFLAALLAQPALACTDRIRDRALAASVDQLAEADAGTGREAAEAVRAALEAGAAEYCAGYELARYQTLNGDYDGARQTLIEALDHVTQADLEDTAPWNVIGYSWLQQRDYQAALTSFTHQIKHPTFAAQPENTKMKVLNNAGFAALQVGQYDQAIEALSTSRDLGSRTGARNLAIAESILETLKSGDIDAPGVFTTVVMSLRNPENVQTAVDKAAGALGSDSEISVFRSQNGFYAISYGAYESYPKSELRQEMAKEKGFEDAYTTSLAEWQDVTVEFLGKR